MSDKRRTPRALCAVEAIPEVGARGFTVRMNGRDVDLFVVRVAGEVRAYRNSCPHTGVSLNWIPDQFLDAECRLIQCSMHGALFQPLTGECIHGPCRGDFLEPVPLIVEDGMIHLPPDIPDAASA